MNFIDTHAHIYVENMIEDSDNIIYRAKQAGISKILMPNIDVASISPMLSLTKEFPNYCYPMLGLHPCDVKDDYKTALDAIFSQFSSEYIAVGEIGLDLYWDKTTLNRQIDAFRYQADVAIEKELPISVHVRDAFPQMLELLEDYRGKGLKGVLHCFTGTFEQATQAIDLGFYLGVGGVLTFKNSGVDKTLANIGLEHLILETDSPYLAPSPYRGKQNEPSYLPLIAKRLAEIHHINIEEVAKQTAQNANRLFKLS
ncbi:TatD DNase family protein [Balneicella halophila]|uniref:TatD DNase family protein n=1 Tax=Balneicella halophila TaxID=1537566 RepID=A0A7L4US50_BALHA|nr:TatD family hydrolase [Balneicella halophila]PVX52608.1 TatD DNase family protein [Balneicella halophila]